MSRHRWTIIAVCFFAIIIVYLDRSALSYAISPLEKTFHLNNEDFGLLASAFGLGYLFMTIGGGILVDRFGSRKIWTLSAIAWSVACIFIGFATGFIWILVFRILLGIAEGPSFPAFTRVTADWLPASERARALALGLAAVPFSSVIGAPLTTHLIANFGWRFMFIILGSVGILWAIIWYIIFRDKPTQSNRVSQSERQFIEENLDHKAAVEFADLKGMRTTWRFMLFNPSLLVNNYAFFAFGYLLFFAITWLPGYLEQSFHLRVKEVGWFLTLPWITATFTILLGGALSDWLLNKTGSMRIALSRIIWVCQILSAFAFIPVMFHPSLPLAIMSLSLGIGLGLMPNAAFYAVNADLARDRAATSLGIMDCAFAASGIIAPYLTGFLTDTTGNFSIAFGVMVFLNLSSALAVYFWQLRPKKRAIA